MSKWQRSQQATPKSEVLIGSGDAIGHPQRQQVKHGDIHGEFYADSLQTEQLDTFSKAVGGFKDILDESRQLRNEKERMLIRLNQALQEQLLTRSKQASNSQSNLQTELKFKKIERAYLPADHSDLRRKQQQQMSSQSGIKNNNTSSICNNVNPIDLQKFTKEIERIECEVILAERIKENLCVNEQNLIFSIDQLKTKSNALAPLIATIDKQQHQMIEEQVKTDAQRKMLLAELTRADSFVKKETKFYQDKLAERNITFQAQNQAIKVEAKNIKQIREDKELLVMEKMEQEEELGRLYDQSKQNMQQTGQTEVFLNILDQINQILIFLKISKDSVDNVNDVSQIGDLFEQASNQGKSLFCIKDQEDGRNSNKHGSVLIQTSPITQKDLLWIITSFLDNHGGISADEIAEKLCFAYSKAVLQQVTLDNRLGSLVQEKEDLIGQLKTIKEDIVIAAHNYQESEALAIQETHIQKESKNQSRFTEKEKNKDANQNSHHGENKHGSNAASDAKYQEQSQETHILVQERSSLPFEERSSKEQELDAQGNIAIAQQGFPDEKESQIAANNCVTGCSQNEAALARVTQLEPSAYNQEQPVEELLECDILASPNQLAQNAKDSKIPALLMDSFSKTEKFMWKIFYSLNELVFRLSCLASSVFSLGSISYQQNHLDFMQATEAKRSFTAQIVNLIRAQSQLSKQNQFLLNKGDNHDAGLGLCTSSSSSGLSDYEGMEDFENPKEREGALMRVLEDFFRENNKKSNSIIMISEDDLKSMKNWIKQDYLMCHFLSTSTLRNYLQSIKEEMKQNQQFASFHLHQSFMALFVERIQELKAVTMGQFRNCIDFLIRTVFALFSDITAQSNQLENDLKLQNQLDSQDDELIQQANSNALDSNSSNNNDGICGTMNKKKSFRKRITMMKCRQFQDFFGVEKRRTAASKSRANTIVDVIYETLYDMRRGNMPDLFDGSVEQSHFDGARMQVKNKEQQLVSQFAEETRRQHLQMIASQQSNKTYFLKPNLLMFQEKENRQIIEMGKKFKEQVKSSSTPQQQRGHTKAFTSERHANERRNQLVMKMRSTIQDFHTKLRGKSSNSKEETETVTVINQEIPKVIPQYFQRRQATLKSQATSSLGIQTSVLGSTRNYIEGAGQAISHHRIAALAKSTTLDINFSGIKWQSTFAAGLLDRQDNDRNMADEEDGFPRISERKVNFVNELDEDFRQRSVQKKKKKDGLAVGFADQELIENDDSPLIRDIMNLNEGQEQEEEEEVEQQITCKKDLQESISDYPNSSPSNNDHNNNSGFSTSSASPISSILRKNLKFNPISLLDKCLFQDSISEGSLIKTQQPSRDDKDKIALTKQAAPKNQIDSKLSKKSLPKLNAAQSNGFHGESKQTTSNLSQSQTISNKAIFTKASLISQFQKNKTLIIPHPLGILSQQKYKASRVENSVDLAALKSLKNKKQPEFLTTFTFSSEQQPQSPLILPSTSKLSPNIHYQQQQLRPHSKSSHSPFQRNHKILRI